MTLRALALPSSCCSPPPRPPRPRTWCCGRSTRTDVSWIDAYRDRVAWARGRRQAVDRRGRRRRARGRQARRPRSTWPPARTARPSRSTGAARGSRSTTSPPSASGALKAPAGKLSNWAFWKDRFAVVRDGRLQIVPLTGKARDVGRAKSLEGKTIDFNGTGVAYINQDVPSEDVEAFELAYWPATGPGAGRVVLRAAHGASGDLSLDGPVLSPTKAYADPARRRVRRAVAPVARRPAQRRPRLRGAAGRHDGGAPARREAGGGARVPGLRGRPAGSSSGTSPIGADPREAVIERRRVAGEDPVAARSGAAGPRRPAA